MPVVATENTNGSSSISSSVILIVIKSDSFLVTHNFRFSLAEYST